MISSERASHSSEVSPQAVIPWPPRTTPIASGCRRRISAMSRPSWNPGRRQSTQATRSPKQRSVSASPVGRGGERDARIGVEVVDVRGVDEAVHRRVDRRRGAAAAVEAVVERGDHLVLALDARIHVDERAQAIEPEDGQAGLGQRAEVAAGTLDPQQLDRRAGDRIDPGPLGRRVAARVVGVPRVAAEPVRALDERDHGRARAGPDGLGPHAPQPACWPPTRSASMVAA